MHKIDDDLLLQRGLFCRWCQAPEIHVRCRGKIGEGRPHCDRLVELLRINLVERVVCGVMGVEISSPSWRSDTAGTPAFCSSRMSSPPPRAGRRSMLAPSGAMIRSSSLSD